MARAPSVYPDADAIRALVDRENRLAVRVTPGARLESLEISEAGLTAKVRAKPQDGKANDAVRKLLARALCLAPSEIELERGATSRLKQFRIAE